MATTKAGGTAKNLRDSNPKYLGLKRADGALVHPGEVIVRQRGTTVMAGTNVGIAVDHTLFALAKGHVKFTTARKNNFDGKISRRVKASVIAA